MVCTQSEKALGTPDWVQIRDPRLYKSMAYEAVPSVPSVPSQKEG
jgi:hypothetical protein